MSESIEEKVALRDRASAAYYEGNKIMSDDAFDALTAELDAAGVDQEVGHGYAPAGAKVEHTKPMLSLDKVRTPGEIERWAGQSAISRFLVQPKFDGLAASITYGADGTVTQAATRGNGWLGEDVLHTVKAMQEAGSLPAKVETRDGVAVVRGEIVVRRSELERLNESPLTHRTYVNPRNAAAGLLRRTDTSLAEFLTFVAFDSDVEFTEDTDTWLSESGFLTPAAFYQHVADSVDEVFAHIEHFASIMDNLDVDTDGLVIKADAPADRIRLGASRTAPRWSVAYKYPNRFKETTLRNVEWSTGRTGRIVPVAIFDGVQLSGSTVSYSTLHNLDQLNEHDVWIGDTISVTRSNEVIPYISGRVGPHAEDATPVAIPTECPNCGGPVHVDGADLMCDQGANCNAVAKIVHSLSVLGVLGVGHSLVRSLIEADEIEDFLDLLNVAPQHIEALEGYGEVSARKAVDAIDVVYDASLRWWIAAIGIPMVGSTMAPLLEERYGSLEALSEATYDDLIQIPGFGPAKAQAVVDAQDTIAEWDDRLRREHFWSPEPEEAVEVKESEFTGLNVVVTGTLPTLKRGEVSAWLEEHGANVQGGVNGKTDLLIAGEKAGSKLAKAESLGVRIMDGVTFEQDHYNA